MKRLRRPSPALVISLIALFVAMSGVGYAATKLNGRQIQKNSIPGAKLITNSVHGKKLKNGKVHGKKLKNGTVTGPKINEGTLGEVPNAANAADAAQLGGVAASAYLRSPIRRVEAISANTSAAGQFRNVTASCPTGERAIAGGGMWTQLNGSPTGLNVLQGTRPVPSTDGTDVTTGWQATGISDNAAARQLRAYVLCIPQ